MDDREFFCKRHRAEFPTFMKVLEAMPVDQFDYRPHARSPSALDLVWTLAKETGACTTVIHSGEVRWDPPPAPLPREALRIFHANYEALDERVNRLGDEAWRTVLNSTRNLRENVMDFSTLFSQWSRPSDRNG
jgi:hypothetical protein